VCYGLYEKDTPNKTSISLFKSSMQTHATYTVTGNNYVINYLPHIHEVTISDFQYSAIASLIPGVQL